MASLTLFSSYIRAAAGRTRQATSTQRRILDEATRRRRQQRQLEALEKDNFQDDPHAAYAHLVAKAKLPAFADGSESVYQIYYTKLYTIKAGVMFV